MLDGSVKLISAVVIMTIAGWCWLWVGAKLGSLSMSFWAEKLMNYTFALGVLVAGSFALLL